MQLLEKREEEEEEIIERLEQSKGKSTVLDRLSIADNCVWRRYFVYLYTLFRFVRLVADPRMLLVFVTA